MGDIEVTRDDVSVLVGDTVTVRLPQNASTGYVWGVEAVGEGLSVDEDSTIAPGDSAPGAGGQHVVRLRAERAGSWQVRLRHARPWEPDGGEQRVVTVTVV